MTAQSGSALVLRDVQRSYGQTCAVDCVSMEIAEGCIVGLAGPNGSGKSTLARIAAGFSRPDSGTAVIRGVSSHMWRRMHGVGYVSEDGLCGWPRASARELLSLHGHRAAEAGQLAAILGIGHLMDRQSGSLSKGQWRLVQCLYALATLPRLIVMDEPDSGLDPAAMSRLRTAIAFCAGTGSAIVVLSHHLDELALLADQVCFMSQGRIVATAEGGTTAASQLRDLYARRVGDA